MPNPVLADRARSCTDSSVNGIVISRVDSNIHPFAFKLTHYRKTQAETILPGEGRKNLRDLLRDLSRSDH